MNAKERKIEALLNAAFTILQHDTGPTNVEWVWQRKQLKEMFTEILTPRKRDKKTP